MTTFRQFLSAGLSHLLAFCARSYSGRVVLAAAVAGLLVGALLL